MNVMVLDGCENQNIVLYKSEGGITSIDGAGLLGESDDRCTSCVKDAVRECINVPGQTGRGDVVDVGIDAEIGFAIHVKIIQGDKHRGFLEKFDGIE